MMSSASFRSSRVVNRSGRELYRAAAAAACVGAFCADCAGASSWPDWFTAEGSWKTFCRNANGMVAVSTARSLSWETRKLSKKAFTSASGPPEGVSASENLNIVSSPPSFLVNVRASFGFAVKVSARKCTDRINRAEATTTAGFSSSVEGSTGASFSHASAPAPTLASALGFTRAIAHAMLAKGTRR